MIKNTETKVETKIVYRDRVQYIEVEKKPSPKRPLDNEMQTNVVGLEILG